MMKKNITIIPRDLFISVDGIGYSGISMEGVSGAINAIRWDGESGTIEYRNRPGLEKIKDISPFDFVVQRWETEHILRRKEESDEFHNMTISGAKDLLIKKVARLALEAKDKNFLSGRLDLDPVGIQGIRELHDHATLATQLDYPADWTIDVITRNTRADGKRRRVTMSPQQVLKEVGNIYFRNEKINQMAQDINDEIMTLPTLQAVRDYQLPKF